MDMFKWSLATSFFPSLSSKLVGHGRRAKMCDNAYVPPPEEPYGHLSFISGVGVGWLYISWPYVTRKECDYCKGLQFCAQDLWGIPGLSSQGSRQGHIYLRPAYSTRVGCQKHIISSISAKHIRLYSIFRVAALEKETLVSVGVLGEV